MNEEYLKNGLILVEKAYKTYYHKNKSLFKRNGMQVDDVRSLFKECLLICLRQTRINDLNHFLAILTMKFKQEICDLYTKTNALKKQFITVYDDIIPEDYFYVLDLENEKVLDDFLLFCKDFDYKFYKKTIKILKIIDTKSTKKAEFTNIFKRKENIEYIKDFHRIYLEYKNIQ